MAPPAEISIPSTSLSTTPKPHTLYTITLRLPLRSFVVQKRYNDFVDLNKTLTQAVGAPPPLHLPGKHWFKNTINNPELTEERRIGLERYLRVIAESPDRRWRDTPAWRTFLNLPPGTGGSISQSSASAVGASSAASKSARALIDAANPATRAGATDPTIWLDLYKEAKSGLNEARVLLSRCESCAEGSTAALEASTAARRSLVKVGTLLPTLSQALEAMRTQLGEGEMRRRRDLLAWAKGDKDGLEKLAAAVSLGRHNGGSHNPLAGDHKTELMAGASAGSGRTSSPAVKTGRRAIGAPLPETDKTRELDNSGVLQLQKDTMKDQDESINQLAEIVARQKQLGLQIHQEVDEQTRMLEYMDTDVTRLQGKIGVANNRTRKLGK